MGGSVFAQGPNPLHTPRMPPHIYHKVKRDCHAALLDLFLCVASPIDGPAKKDFGDIDILVAWKKQDILGPNTAPRPKRAPDDFALIERALSAQRMTRNKGDSSAHFALAWPEDDAPADHQDHQRRHIQVDVRICDSLQKLEWMLFKHAHGDLWNIIGSTIRPYGLTVDEDALYIRIPEIEHYNRNLAKVKISSDPAEVLGFLGLSMEDGVWDEPFRDVNDLYEYAATTPLFWVRPAEVDDDEDQAKADKKKLKSNDRKRMKSRACYARWVEEFLPRCRAEGRFLEQQKSRSSVRQEVFERFHTQYEYAKVLRDFTIERQKQDIWKMVKERFPELNDGNSLYQGCLRNSFKRIIWTGDITDDVTPNRPLKESDGTYIMENVRHFIETQHDEVGRLAMDIHQSKYRDELAMGKERKRKAGSSPKVLDVE